jgi:hypothetical protein
MDKDKPFIVNTLRGWQRTQLKLLKEFVAHDFLNQTKISGASGCPAGSNALGGKITPLTRAGLIEKAGKDDDGQFVWKFNDKRADRKTIQDLLDEMDI